MHMPHCHLCLLLLCATCAQATVPALGRAGYGHVLVIGSSCAPARLVMHWQSSIQSKVHASGVQTRLLARPGSDLASDPHLSVRMPRGVITQCGPWEPQALSPVYSLPVGFWQLVHIIAVPLSSRRPAQVGRQIMAADMPCTGM
jgi:hypothetical protein